LRDVGIHRRHQLHDRVLTDHRIAAVQRHLGRALDDRDVVAGELVGGEQLAHFHLDQVEQFGVVDQVDLVHVDHQSRHADLTGQEDVLAGLRHRAVAAETTRIAPSIWAAPVIMFFT